jgi:hypothetical protein
VLVMNAVLECEDELADSLTLFLRAIRQHRLLTPAEEAALSNPGRTIGLIRAVEKFDWPARVQVLDVRHLVDPPGVLPGRGRQGHVDPPAGSRPRAPDEGPGHVGADAAATRPPTDDRRARSLNEPVDDDGSELGDLVGDEDAGEEFDEVERRIDASRLLASALHQLPAGERHVVTRRYASEPATLSELSRDPGVCHQRVAQLEDRALSELRKIVAR